VHAICEELDASLDAMQQQQQTSTSSSNGRTSSSSSSSSGSSHAAMSRLFVVLSLVTSPSFRSSVVTEALIEALARYLLAATAGDGQQQQSTPDEQDMANFRTTLLQVLEAISQVGGQGQDNRV